MGAVRHRLRTAGISTDGGIVRVSRLHKALGTLATTARRATGLLATGSGWSNREPVGWLTDTTDRRDARLLEYAR